ncbi:MAG TPA: GIY-YIG nuclease family protein [Candidatus Acidoferrum sp.]|nr:GIY-YIG nuclease family protein [Candidatus Acidoferrum sp.]
MKGVYVLIISLTTGVNVKVGALGKINFKKGTYVYVGSAHTNLQKRVERHLRKVKRRFWHIDYLLCNSNAKVLKVFYKISPKVEECKIAAQLSQGGFPVEGFGSSDCDCKSHLFKVRGYDFLRESMHQLITSQ